ncbi:22679_t:CDS:2, partial [Gigaspora rosea]
TFPELIGDEKEHIWVTYDESIFFINDGMHTIWGLEGEQPLRKKGLGLGVHVSNFLTETIGPLRNNLEEMYLIIVQWAINIFERTHPGCIGLFAFNNAMSHIAFAEDALVALRINFGSGSFVPKMRDTV